MPEHSVTLTRAHSMNCDNHTWKQYTCTGVAPTGPSPLLKIYKSPTEYQCCLAETQDSPRWFNNTIGLCYGHSLFQFCFWEIMFCLSVWHDDSKHYSTHEPQPPLPWRRSQSEAWIKAVKNSKLFSIEFMNKTRRHSCWIHPKYILTSVCISCRNAPR